MVHSCPGKRIVGTLLTTKRNIERVTIQRFILTFVSIFLFTLTKISPAQTRAVVGYYYFWDKSAFPQSMIEYDKVSCIAEAFIVPNKDGSLSAESGATMQDYLYPEMIYAAHNNNVKVVVSVGGWGNGAGFPALAASATARANFASNLKNFCLQYDYDGVDIDWEYPGAGDRANFVLMMKALHDSLNSSGHHLSLSMTSPGYIGSGYDFADLVGL